MDTDDEHSLAILGKAEFHGVEQPPLDLVVEIGQRRENRGEVEAILHRQQALDVFQDEERWVMLLQNVDDRLKECAARVADAFLLAGAAEGLTGKAGGEQVMRRDAFREGMNVPLSQLAFPEPIPIDLAGERRDIIRPNGFQAQ